MLNKFFSERISFFIYKKAIDKKIVLIYFNTRDYED